ncbi:FkbM family methyltransferase [Synechococcus sp. Cruz-9H2]|uniref:FkbM family methyltransferase n=1 Tax=unclassified Synechococcus TaxID=2626047 RepID=UPI0020CD68C7|nr:MULTISPECIES: FkbM family methyltransferase [unclassified Synechococcus]MCP9818145.1 FkbM family methyltransferase [Synechococcus sp. Cruz-9H2]MCP9842355.1 FkbM family methyltransferase [Synechococcus sp. Edmonson 11F2]MCP9854541.1 FkbM family methyltransferase [Synechococcus sp. Cruz-9C9]MCP9861763.1 FkbM family methyltransferase [Synechococcus sp. Cruz-7E5]MCP9869053.1 FkbM family methyltransferase [Synechococcus sp. Cruz-7B9]
MSVALHRSDLEDSIAAYIQERLPMAAMDVVFDVGANHGWFTYLFLQHYPQAHYYLFEPVASIHAECYTNLSKFPIFCEERTLISRLALSSTDGQGMITAEPDVTVNHLVMASPSAETKPAIGGPPTESVPLCTGAGFCQRHGINRIHFLKIDCEGHDLEVLRGFEPMLAIGAVDFVQVECSVSSTAPTASFLQPWVQVDALLRGYGYELFRFTNQASDDLPFLARADVVWIHRSAAEACLKA